MSFTRENASGYTPDLSPLSNPPSNYLVPSNLENQPSFSNGVELNPSVQGFWTFNETNPSMHVPGAPLHNSTSVTIDTPVRTHPAPQGQRRRQFMGSELVNPGQIPHGTPTFQPRPAPPSAPGSAPVPQRNIAIPLSNVLNTTAPAVALASPINFRANSTTVPRGATAQHATSLSAIIEASNEAEPNSSILSTTAGNTPQIPIFTPPSAPRYTEGEPVLDTYQGEPSDPAAEHLRLLEQRTSVAPTVIEMSPEIIANTISDAFGLPTNPPPAPSPALSLASNITMRHQPVVNGISRSSIVSEAPQQSVLLGAPRPSTVPQPAHTHSTTFPPHSHATSFYPAQSFIPHHNITAPQPAHSARPTYPNDNNSHPFDPQPHQPAYAPHQSHYAPPQPHYVPHQPHHAHHQSHYVPPQENPNLTAHIMQQQARENEQRRAHAHQLALERSQQQAFEAEQRRLDREAQKEAMLASQAAMLSVAEQLKDNQSQLNTTLSTNAQRTNNFSNLTQKIANSVRINPPPKFQKDNNLIVHFRTKVEHHIIEYYNHSRAEQILAIGHVFPQSVSRKQLARKIAEELLPAEPTTAEHRLPVYRAIVDKLGLETDEGEFTPILSTEDIDHFFERTRIIVEETRNSDVEWANAKVFRLMIDPKRKLISTELRMQLDILVDSQLPGRWRNGISCRQAENIITMLSAKRDRLDISEKHVHNVNTSTSNFGSSYKPAFNKNQNSAQPTPNSGANHFNSLNQAPIITNLSKTVPKNQSMVCFHCRRNDMQGKSHTVRNCPCKHKCGSCLTFKYYDKSEYAYDAVDVPAPFSCKRHADRNRSGGYYDASGVKVIRSRQINNVHHSGNSTFSNPPAPISNFVNRNNIDTEAHSVAHINFTRCFLHQAPTPAEFFTGNIREMADPNNDVDLPLLDIPLFCNLARTHDKFHYLLPTIFNGDGDKVEFPMVVDTGCDADGVVSLDYIKQYKLDKFINTRSFATVSVANGNSQKCKTLDLSIPLPERSVDLRLIILDSCPAGALIGLPGCVKIAPNAMSGFMTRLNMSFKPTKN